MSMGTRQRYNYLWLEYEDCANRVVHRITQCTNNADDVDITGEQLLQLTTMNGCDDLVVPEVGQPTHDQLCFMVELDYNGTRDYRTKEVVVSLNSPVCMEGWTAEGSLDGLAWSTLDTTAESSRFYARHPSYDPGNCATQYMVYQYFRFRYDHDQTEIGQSVKRVIVTPYSTDCDTGVDLRMDSDSECVGGSTAATNADSGMPTDTMFFAILDENPLDLSGNGCSIQGLEIMKDDTSAVSPNILYVMALRRTASGFYVVDSQPLDTGNMINANASAATTGEETYKLLFDVPPVDVQDGDLLAITGINMRIRQVAAAGYNQTYIGAYTAPWNQVSVGDTLPYTDFETWGYRLYCDVLSSDEWTDDFGTDDCGTNMTDSGHCASGLAARLDETGPAVQIHFRNSHATMTKDLALDIPIGPRFEITTAYTVGDDHLHIISDTTNFPFDPWNAGLNPPQFVLPGPGRGMIYSQADGIDGTITRYYLEWTAIDRPGADCVLGGAVEQDIVWYDDCDYGTPGGEPASIDAGMIFVYVPKYVEVSDDLTNWYKALETALPLVCEDVAPGDYSPGGSTQCTWYARYNYDGVTSFADGVYPMEMVMVEEEEQIE